MFCANIVQNMSLIHVIQFGADMRQVYKMQGERNTILRQIAYFYLLTDA